MKKTKKGTHRDRGFWLSLILVVMAVHGIIGTFLYTTIRAGETPDRPWIVSLMVLHSLANVLAAVGIWLWKKWSLYVYAASTALAIFVGLVSIGIWSLGYMFLPFAIIGWVLRTKWDYFE